jgi:hypothetical protein
VHWALRREQLCDPGLCPDAPDGGGRCEHCPLDRLVAAQCAEKGLLIRRALDLMSALELFFEKETVRVVVENPRAVQAATMTATKANAGRREMTRLQLSPGLIVS